MTPATSTLIVARDAGTTIGRAVRSALDQGTGPIVLVDDRSTDDTVAAALAAAGASAAARLQVVRSSGRTLGAARQVALDVASTPLAAWLDADDELLPGREQRLAHALEAREADVVWDAAEIVDGPDGAPRGVAAMAPFLLAPGGPVRLFERSYLPAPGAPMVRVETARQVGYDAGLEAAEDVDFSLRAIDSGARIELVAEPGYRTYAYPDSLSRRRAHQLGWYRAVLAKHDDDRIAALYAQAGHSPAVTAWALVSVALFRGDWGAARRHLDGAASAGPARDRVLEPHGPCRRSEGWRLCFTAGTLALLTGDDELATERLVEATAIEEAAEALNNLGVAWARAGRTGRARDCFERAVRLAPGYADARTNLAALDDPGAPGSPDRVTTHPFRSTPTRTDYGPTRPASPAADSGRRLPR